MPATPDTRRHRGGPRRPASHARVRHSHSAVRPTSASDGASNAGGEGTGTSTLWATGRVTSSPGNGSTRDPRAPRLSASMRSAVAGEGAQPIGQRNDVWVRPRLELLLQQQRVQSRLLERSRTVTGPVQRSHQPQRHASIVRLLRNQASPPFYRAAPFPPLLGRFREALQTAGVRAAQAVPLSVRPVFELGRAGQMKAIQERTGIEADRALELACRNRILEGDHVTRYCGRIQSQLVLNRDYPSLTDRSSQRVDALVQQVAGVFHVALRPEPARPACPGSAAGTGSWPAGQGALACAFAWPAP